jgi:hypothetical protein
MPNTSICKQILDNLKWLKIDIYGNNSGMEMSIWRVEIEKIIKKG